MSNIHENCVKYLQENASRTIMLGIKKKYESLNKAGGSFILNKPTSDEKEFLSRLFKKDYSYSKSITINLIKFEASFKDTVYDGMILKDVLEIYFEETVTGNKIKKETLEKKKTDFLDQEAKKHPLIEPFIKKMIQEKKGAYRWFLGLYKVDQIVLEKILDDLEHLIKAMESCEFVVLPVLAAQVTKDPHALDVNRPLYKALLYYMGALHALEYPKSAEDQSTLLELAGVVNNNINKMVMTYGLKSRTNKGWLSFFNQNEPLILTDMSILKKDIISINQKMYCFENPSVFLMFIKKYPNKSALCTGGQINQTVYGVLDQLYDKTQLYYSGDFDPEGLMISNKLKKRYASLNLIGYSQDLYLKSMSENIISQKRLNQLKNLDFDDLKEIGALILLHKHAGYQEYILDELLELCD